MQVRDAVEGFLLDCRARGLSARTVGFYVQKLTYLADWLHQSGAGNLAQVSTSDLRAFILHLQEIDSHLNNPRIPKLSGKHISAFTIKGYVQTMKTLFRWAFTEGLIDKDPAARVVRPKIPHYLIPTLSLEQIEAMMNACDPTTAIGFRDQMVMLLLLDTGIRVSELCGLKLKDIYEDYIVVMGKGSKQREIGISPMLSKYLWKYIRLYRKPADPQDQHVVLSYRGHPMTPSAVAEILSTVRQRAGISGVRVSPHVFRHTFARTYLTRGGNVYKLSRLMGIPG